MGNITNINKLIGVQAETNSFGYDGLNRLTSATNPAITGLAASETYDYDATGNRLGLTYDAWNRINTALGKAYTYDADGNPNNIGGATLSHDNDGRMTQYASNNYTYDPEWRRIKKVTASGTRYYVWEGERLIAEYDQTGTRVARYGYLPNDYSPSEVEINNVVYQVRSDHLGTPLELVNASNNVVWRAHYESFGKPVINDDVDGDGTHVEFNVRLPGQYFDQETGLSYNWHRYYDPTTGRYISSDPIGLRGGINTYAYVQSSPINYSDPFGLETTMVCRPVYFGPVYVGEHCFVVVWHWEDNGCGSRAKVIDDQFSLGENDTNPANESGHETYDYDRNLFYTPNNQTEFYNIPPPPGTSQSEFDMNARMEGHTYTQGPYNGANGPNSNTAADNIIENAGGAAPNVMGAWNQNYGE